MWFIGFRLCFKIILHAGTVILLENLRFHIEEEGKGVDKDGKKVKIPSTCLLFLDITTFSGEIFLFASFRLSIYLYKLFQNGSPSLLQPKCFFKRPFIYMKLF
jgi:hypothetical protein